MSRRSRKLAIALLQVAVAALVSLLLFPSEWYPDRMKATVAGWIGTPGYRQGEARRLPPVEAVPRDAAIVPCPADLPGWREAQRIEGVDIAASPACVVDDPYAIAAFVRGTNNVSMETLMQAGLAPDAVLKSDDLDGDGDPDIIHIRLEVVELNGASPDLSVPAAAYEVAPGFTPGLWVFAPKSFGMATENFESNDARQMLRAPSPTIRVEQGDRVTITLENSHYLGHTIHFHGVDHPFLDADGQGNDGAPVTSEMPVPPGGTRSYEMQPRHAGTMFYHCHVQVQVHVMMGLQGMFVVEENRPNNWLQTLNIGAGHVRVPSVEVTENYDSEYDLHFTDLDPDLNNRIQWSNDAGEIERLVNRDYDVTQAHSELFTLNGRAFPYTFRESLVVVEPDQQVKLRVLNGGGAGLALHTHGHKPTATHYDGVALSEPAQITRDVHWLASAQRADLLLDTRNDGLHAYGSGVWMLHDHQERGVTNGGLAPGGNMGAIVYRDFLRQDGWPITYGEDLETFFDPDYYRRLPIETSNLGDGTGTGWFLRVMALGVALGILAAGLMTVYRFARGRQ